MSNLAAIDDTIQLVYTIQIALGLVVLYDYGPASIRAIAHAAKNWAHFRDMCHDRFFLLSGGIVLSWFATTLFATYAKTSLYLLDYGADYSVVMYNYLVPIMLLISCLAATCHIQASQHRVTSWPLIYFAAGLAVAEYALTRFW